MKRGDVGQRQIDICIGQDDLCGLMFSGQHGQRDDANAGAAVMGQQRVSAQLPLLRDRVDQKACIVIKRIRVGSGGLFGEADIRLPDLFGQAAQRY